MRYKISLSENGTYVRIRVFEAITGEIEKEFAEIAIKDAKQRKISKFLVDVRGTLNIASSLEQYLFGYEDMNQFGLDRGSRIAVLADANDKSHNFIETIFVNAGYHCRIFTDEDAASKWLGE
ncbi:hypothetical protein ACFL03_09395 [Thermodesulfobacteriota bacterium]